MSPRWLRETEERLERLGWTVLFQIRVGPDQVAVRRQPAGRERYGQRRATRHNREAGRLGAAGHGDRQYRNALSGRTGLTVTPGGRRACAARYFPSAARRAGPSDR